MPIPLILKIDTEKIRQDWLFEGQKGTYLDAVLYENDRPSEYGDTHVIKQSPNKEAREAGERPVIIGNAKPMPQRGNETQYKRPIARPQQERQKPRPAPPLESDGFEENDIPF